MIARIRTAAAFGLAAMGWVGIAISKALIFAAERVRGAR